MVYPYRAYNGGSVECPATLRHVKPRYISTMYIRFSAFNGYLLGGRKL